MAVSTAYLVKAIKYINIKMNIKRFCFNPMQTNCYVVNDDENHAIIIDPCCSSVPEYVLNCDKLILKIL